MPMSEIVSPRQQHRRAFSPLQEWAACATWHACGIWHVMCLRAQFLVMKCWGRGVSIAVQKCSGVISVDNFNNLTIEQFQQLKIFEFRANLPLAFLVAGVVGAIFDPGLQVVHARDRLFQARQNRVQSCLFGMGVFKKSEFSSVCQNEYRGACLGGCMCCTYLCILLLLLYFIVYSNKHSLYVCMHLCLYVCMYIYVLCAYR